MAFLLLRDNLLHVILLASLSVTPLILAIKFPPNAEGVASGVLTFRLEYPAQAELNPLKTAEECCRWGRCVSDLPNSADSPSAVQMRT